MAAASASLVVSSAWISRASAASSIVRGRVRSSTSTEPVTQHASCSQTESIRTTPSNSPEAAVAGGQQQGLRRGRSVGGEGGVVERGARGRQRTREREFAAAGLHGAHQVDHAARPLRPSERLHRHEVPAFLPAPRNLGRNNARSRAFNATLATPTSVSRASSKPVATGPSSRPVSAACSWAAAIPRCLATSLSLGVAARRVGMSTEPIASVAGRRRSCQPSVFAASTIARPASAVCSEATATAWTAAMLSPTIGRRLGSWMDGCPAAATAERCVIAGVFEERAAPPRGRRSPPRPRPRPGRCGPRPRPGTSAGPPRGRPAPEDHGGGCQAGHDGQEHPRSRGFSGPADAARGPAVGPKGGGRSPAHPSADGSAR